MTVLYMYKTIDKNFACGFKAKWRAKMTTSQMDKLDARHTATHAHASGLIAIQRSL